MTISYPFCPNLSTAVKLAAVGRPLAAVQGLPARNKLQRDGEPVPYALLIDILKTQRVILKTEKPITFFA